MVLEGPREPLQPAGLPDPRPDAGQVLISVQACGVCRTDLHIVDGDLERPKLPLVPGHQIVGTVLESGERAERFPRRTSATAPASPAMTSTVATSVGGCQ
jgi:propanol-preferring alcohol dehydrogenase